MMTPEEWKSRILKAVHKFGDSDYQYRSWFAIGPEVDSPDEMFCELFDDLQFEEFLRANAGVLSGAQQRAARELCDRLNEYANATPTTLQPEDVVQDPRWDEIRRLAIALLST